MLTPDRGQQLMAYGNKLRVYVSLGGFDQETYRKVMRVDQFSRVSNHIKSLVKAKRDSASPTEIVMSVRCPISKCNGDFWDQLNEYKNQGLLCFDFTPRLRFDTWAGKVTRSELKSVGLLPMPQPYKRGACELLYMKPAILANGRVNACACRDVDAQLIIGDVNKSQLTDVWNGKGLDEIISCHEKGDFPEVCRKCTFYVSVYNSRQSSIFDKVFNWKSK